MSGCVMIVGLGPGNEGHITPLVSEAVGRATDVIGYIP